MSLDSANPPPGAGGIFRTVLKIAAGLAKEPVFLAGFGFGVLILAGTVTAQMMEADFTLAGWIFLALYGIGAVAWLTVRVRRDATVDVRKSRDTTVKKIRKSKVKVRGSKNTKIEDVGGSSQR